MERAHDLDASRPRRQRERERVADRGVDRIEERVAREDGHRLRERVAPRPQDDLRGRALLTEAEPRRRSGGCRARARHRLEAPAVRSRRDRSSARDRSVEADGRAGPALPERDRTPASGGPGGGLQRAHLERDLPVGDRAGLHVELEPHDRQRIRRPRQAAVGKPVRELDLVPRLAAGSGWEAVDVK